MERLLKLIVAMQVRMTRSEDRGATATEYALLVALIAIVIAVAVGIFGTSLNTFFQNIADTVDGWT